MPYKIGQKIRLDYLGESKKHIIVGDVVIREIIKHNSIYVYRFTVKTLHIDSKIYLEDDDTVPEVVSATGETKWFLVNTKNSRVRSIFCC